MIPIYFLSDPCESGFIRLSVLPNFGFQGFLHHRHFGTHHSVPLIFAIPVVKD